MLRQLQQQWLRAFRQRSIEILAAFEPNGALSLQRCLAIYTGSITETLAKSLALSFPVCQRLVGELAFRGFAYQFVKQQDLTVANLLYYHPEFITFIAQHPRLVDHCYLADVCRLEWAWQQAYYAAQANVMDFSVLAHMSVDQQSQLIFQLPAHATLLKSAYPIKRIFEVNQAGYQGDQTVHLDEGGVHLLIWRQDCLVRVDVVDELIWHCLHDVSRGLCLASLCDKYYDKMDFCATLPHFLQQGWITGFASTPLSTSAA